MPWDTGEEAGGHFSQVLRYGTKEVQRQKELRVTFQATQTAGRQRRKVSQVRLARKVAGARSSNASVKNDHQRALVKHTDLAPT